MIKFLIYAAVLFLSLTISGNQVETDRMLKPMNNDSSGYTYHLFKELKLPEGDYYCKDTITAAITLKNTGNRETKRRVDYSIYNWNGKKTDTVSAFAEIARKGEKEIELNWLIPPSLPSGNYYSEISIWQVEDSKVVQDSKKINTGKVLGEKPVEKFLYRSMDRAEIKVYRHKDEFEVIDEKIWNISSKTLGRSLLNPRNVKAEDGYLTIQLPMGTMEGGEIFTKELQAYGLYEARMKLPKATSSLTGFFFYLEPDYYYEIDIEVLNNSEAELYLTAYHGGRASKTYRDKLDSDPSEDFHLYRIEYQEESLSFYVDNRKIQEWESGYPKTPMHLFINCWYPKWLEGKKAESNEKLFVDWIKY